MKYKLLVLISSILIISCENSSQNKKEIAKEKPVVAGRQDPEGKSEVNKKQLQIDCENYWKTRFPGDSLKAVYINNILSESKLSENNLRSLNALKNEKEDGLAFENVLSPIFRLSNTEIGIFTFPKRNENDMESAPVSKEGNLVKKYNATEKDSREQSGKVTFYPTLLNSLLHGEPKPRINYYTTSKRGSTQLSELGAFVGECLEYYEYSVDTTNISISDKVLFSSPYVIDLVLENYPKIDLLLQHDFKIECLDCPSSTKFQKTFAKVKGTDNLYFVYADTFPINNKLDTPSRALILINEKSEVIYLWYDEIDLFGCSCL